jgi:20S proteasome alpha/beta subunit
MTVVVAFLCSDGVVVAADSMLTPSLGGISVGHHKGKKIDLLDGNQIFSFAGDLGQALRFKIMANSGHEHILQVNHPIDYPLAITQALVTQFTDTGIINEVGFNALLAFCHSGDFCCSVFEGKIQPGLLDKNHYYVALGTGKLSADPFLRFLVDIFCKDGQPNVREAIFLSTWVLQHVIDTNSGGVDGPIRIATLERINGSFICRELTTEEIDDKKQVVLSANEALINWKNDIFSGAAAENIPPMPKVGGRNGGTSTVGNG